jgi:magnesium transporter
VRTASRRRGAQAAGQSGGDRIVRAMARTRLYRDGELVREDFPVGEISDHIAEPDACVWLDYCEPTGEELATIAEELQLHPLAVEDAVNEHQRPKLDRYDTHLFMSVYALSLDTASGELLTSEIGVFITPHALVTVRKNEGVDIEAVVARWDETKELAKHGVSFLLWGLLDFIVDGHFETVQSLDSEIEQLEDLLFDDAPRESEVQRRSYEFRKSLVLLRRLVLPMREVVNSLMRRDLHVLDQEMAPYYQDVYDHVMRATDWTESLRDLVTTILETNITIQGNRMNLVMKKVTSWAAIIAVPTAITGFYGQNVPYPGFSTHWGFWFSAGLIVFVSGGLYVAFRRRDWL